MSSKKVNVILPTGLRENVAAINVLAESIEGISNGIKAIQNGPLTEDALLLLIQANAKVKSSAGRTSKVTISLADIRCVLNSMDSLAETYLKPREQNASNK